MVETQHRRSIALERNYRQVRERLFNSPPPPPPPPPPAPLASPPSPRVSARDDRLTVGKIMKATCLEFGCSRVQLLSRRREMPIVLRRFIAIGLSLRFTRNSLPQIGSHFHLDHSTVLNASRRIRPVVDAVVDEWPEATIAELIHELRGRIEANGWLGRRRTWEAAHDL
jgi:hypothetical protein